jgi:CHASE3 domain sensor protein
MPESRDLATLERELAQLNQQLPRHSIPPMLLVRIEELEEAIAVRRAEANQTCKARRET